MIPIPFSPEKFSEECKARLSGVYLTYEYANIESTLAKVARAMAEQLGDAAYARIVSDYAAQNIAPDSPQRTAADYLQRAMLHFAFYEHLIFLQLNIKNDGITTKKNDEETTAFKYQTDELKNTLINAAWFWFNELVAHMDANPDVFAEWKNSEQKKLLESLEVTYAEFNRWFAISSWYFFIKARYIIQEVALDEISPRWPPPRDKSNATLLNAMHRALAYKTMAIAAFRFAYSELPESIRHDIDNEQSKTSKAQEFTHVKENVSRSIDALAEEYLRKLEQAVAADRVQAEATAAGSAKQTATYVPERTPRENDKFYFA
jgi:hypothetical protein